MRTSTIALLVGIALPGWIGGAAFLYAQLVASLWSSPLNIAPNMQVSSLALGPGPFAFDGTNQAQFTQTQADWRANGSLGAVYGQRVATYSEGAKDDASAPVNAAVRGYTQSQAQNGRAVEAGGLFVTDNYSDRVQGVGVTGQGNSRHGGRVWGLVAEAHEWPEVFEAKAGQTSFVVLSGFNRIGAVTKKGAILKEGADYRVENGGVQLAQGAAAGDVIKVYRGNPAQGIVGSEVDVFAGAGRDDANPYSGNRVGLGVVGYRRDKSVPVMTHVGSIISVIADPSDTTHLIADRGIGFQGQFETGIDMTSENARISGAAIKLKAIQAVSIGAASMQFPLEIQGGHSTRPDGVQTRWRDDTVRPIDVRCGAVGIFAAGACGTYSPHDWIVWSHGAALARFDAGSFRPERPDASLGADNHRWSIFGSSLTLAPPTTAMPVQPGDLVIEKTSDTRMTIKLRGADGVVRSATLTLMP